jgi:UDP-N-acetylmuramate dehydrogenase
MALRIRENVPLAPLTTFELGGPARWYAEATSAEEVAEAFDWAGREGCEVTILGGGSNVVIADEGIDGLVLRVAPRGVSFEGGAVVAHAGEPWDPFVASCIERGLAGLECLSGIPGLAGAAPIQNVGAYGQEVSETIRSVRVLDRIDRAVRELPSAQCGFAYRDSFFKQVPDRFVVLAVTFDLRPRGEPAIRYAELDQALAGTARPSLREVRDTVIALRRDKSMVIDPADPNRRCAGSFFTNPILDRDAAAEVVARAVASGAAADASAVPQWPTANGRVKLAAAWLIERSAIDKGLRRGNVGISTRHCLALVHHGGGTTRELLALAREVRDAVHARWGVTLVLEPTLIGCSG